MLESLRGTVNAGTSAFGHAVALPRATFAYIGQQLYHSGIAPGLSKDDMAFELVQCIEAVL